MPGFQPVASPLPAASAESFPARWHLLRNLARCRARTLQKCPCSRRPRPSCPCARTHGGDSKVPGGRLASRSSATLTLFPGPAQLATCGAVGVRGGAGQGSTLGGASLTPLKPCCRIPVPGCSQTLSDRAGATVPRNRGSWRGLREGSPGGLLKCVAPGTTLRFAESREPNWGREPACLRV